MLQVIGETGESVLTLTEAVEEAELMRSRLTRPEVLRQLRTLADTLEALPQSVREQMPEIDWAGWRAARRAFHEEHGTALNSVLWFAVKSLVPATLSWLRVYRKSHPQLFNSWG
ncbi:MAG TPA: hypothetical protein VFV25_07060 [Methylibium sp.]